MTTENNRYFTSKIAFDDATQMYLKDSLEVLDTYKNFEPLIKVDWGVPDKKSPLYSGDTMVKTPNDMTGYFEALDLYKSDPFELTIKSIKKIHSTVFKYSNGSKAKGQFKKEDSIIRGALTTGKHFKIETTSAQNTPKEMEWLIHWTNRNLSEKKIHPIVVIALFKYEFTCIHPFDNGNGRTSRILMVLLMIKMGYDFLKYSSLEMAIHGNRKAYQHSLLVPSLHRGTNKEVINGWVLYLVSGLQHMIKQLK